MSGSDLTNKLVAAGLAWLPASLLGEAVGTAISVLDYGALGDGVHDDTAAIQKAATAVGQAGGTLLFPPGTYLVSSPIAISSDTLVQGSGAGSILTTAAVWHDPGIYGPDPYVIFINKNYAASPIVDENIVIENLSFVWTNTQNPGGAHNIRMYAANNVIVRGCTFNGGGDAVAIVGCATSLITGCVAYGQTNCPYDHWGGTTNAKVIGNYASGPFAQSVNFNAILTSSLPLSAYTSSGFICTDNQLYNTGSGSGSINFDTLGVNCVVNNVVIANNILSACEIHGRGNVNNALVSGNIMTAMAGGVEAIFSYTDGTNTPTNISVLGNTIIGASTVPGNLGVIDMRVNGFNIDDNTITGSDYSTAAIYTSTFVGTIGLGNIFTGVVSGTAWSSTQNATMIPNNKGFQFADTVGGVVKFLLDNTNEFSVFGNNGSGVQQLIWQFAQHATGGALALGLTVELARNSANFVRVTGAAAGSSPTIQTDPNSSDTNASLRVLGKGTGGTLVQALSITGPPGTSDIPSGFFAAAPDGSGNIALYYNKAGTIQKIGPFS